RASKAQTTHGRATPTPPPRHHHAEPAPTPGAQHRYGGADHARAGNPPPDADPAEPPKHRRPRPGTQQYGYRASRRLPTSKHRTLSDPGGLGVLGVPQGSSRTEGACEGALP